MKAGAFTPATLIWHLLLGECHESLNEGGGFHPRNPASSRIPSTPSTPLNEGGGFHPRNPASGRLWE